MSDSKAMTVKEQEETALALLEELEGHAGEGSQGLGADDVRPPRLTLAQSGSPQVKKGDPARIEGLEEGHLFNNLTRQIYGDKVRVVVVKFLEKRAMEFWPKDSGQTGVKDFDVALDDPRLEFTTDPKTGKRTKPTATLFFDYLVYLPDTDELVTMSLKNSQLKVAKDINTYIKGDIKVGGQTIKNPPAWFNTFTLQTASKSDNVNRWSILKMDPPVLTEAPHRKRAAEISATFAKKTVVIDRDTDAKEHRDAEVPF
jgi:hypothetical protein